jgi:phage baseplate assembly protein W
VTVAGLGFPLRLDARGRMTVVAGGAAIESSLAVLFGTVAGERVMRPDFGVRPDWTEQELPDRVRELIAAHEPRIEVAGLEFSDLAQQWGTRRLGWAGVRVEYVVKATGERGLFEGMFEWTR